MSARSSELDLPGVTPSRQKRSRETTAALLAAGAEMLRTHSLTELSIEALCREVGATVGAFYSRFESKEAYWANAQSPEQHERFLRLRSLFLEDPEWHDGAIISAT